MKYFIIIISLIVICSCQSIEDTLWESENGDGVSFIDEHRMWFSFESIDEYTHHGWYSKDGKNTYKLIYTNPFDTIRLTATLNNDRLIVTDEGDGVLNTLEKQERPHTRTEIPMSAVVLIAICVILLIWAISKSMENKEKRDEEKSKRETALRTLPKEIENLERQYGKSDIVIPISDDLKIESQVISFSGSGKIYIVGNIYNMKDILDFQIMNNSFLQQGEKEYHSSANLGSALGRALVGGVLTGGVGAVIGGTTGSRTVSETKLEDDKVVQDYAVIISLNDFKTPSVLLNVKSDKVLADLSGLFRTIILRNKQS